MIAITKMPAGTPVSVATTLGPVEVLSFEASAAGPAILYLHGGMGGCDQSLLLARALAIADHPVLALSRPGYLGTPLASGASPQAQADLCAALLDALGIERAALAAVSAGGPAALQFALRHPQRCRGLVLVSACTGALHTSPEVKGRLPLLKAVAHLPLVPQLLQWKLRRDPEAAARRAIPDPALRAQTLSHPEAGALLRLLQLSTFHRLRARLPGTLNDIARFEALDDYPLEDIAAPILIVHGTADRIVPFAHAERVAGRARAADLLALEGGGHVALFTHIDAVRRRAQEFARAHLT
ncbi:MAG: alpha/beta hydrolase [Hyphomicrobiaceae bacterium]|nr:alpha/beta hydrolase [Hyphomicrobiaceae bacterium]